MTDVQTPVPAKQVDWALSLILIAVLGFFGWLWHDTQVRDAALLQNLVAARTAQTTADKQAAVDITQANQALQAQNASLQATLQAAKTTAQQIALINSQVGTHIQAPTPQATNPSQETVEISPTDVTTLAKQTVDFQEAENQVAADMLTIAAQDTKVEARDVTIAAANKEIVALKGGSHFHRFLTATKHVLIGAGIAIAVEEVVKNR